VPSVVFVGKDGSEQTVTAADGISVMRAAIESNVEGSEESPFRRTAKC
jgi:hypothetical protein